MINKENIFYDLSITGKVSKDEYDVRNTYFGQDFKEAFSCFEKEIELWKNEEYFEEDIEIELVKLLYDKEFEQYSVDDWYTKELPEKYRKDGFITETILATNDDEDYEKLKKYLKEIYIMRKN